LRSSLRHICAPRPLNWRCKFQSRQASLRGPSISSHLQFNISHSGTTAPIALVRGCQIGGDVERIPTDLEAEAERFLSAAEKELLSAVPQQHKYAAFFHAKKPYSRPRRRAAPLSDFDVSVAPGEPAALLATRRSWWGRPLASAKHWGVAEQHAAALAVEKTPSQPFQRTVPPSEIPVGGFHPARGRAVVTVVIAAASWSVTGRSPSRNTRCHISRVSRRQMRWP